MTSTKTTLENLLEQVFDDCQEELREELSSTEYEQRRHDFVFHMLDWQEDLERLIQLYRTPQGRELHSVSVFLIGFLYHVIPHLNAAGRLLLESVPDPFAPPASASSAPPPSRELP